MHGTKVRLSRLSAANARETAEAPSCVRLTRASGHPAARSDAQYRAQLTNALAARVERLVAETVALRVPVDGFVERVIGLWQTARNEGVAVELLRRLAEAEPGHGDGLD